MHCLLPDLRKNYSVALLSCQVIACHAQGYRFTEALDNVHHLRDLTFSEEELKQDWAQEIHELLLEMKEAVEQVRGRGQPELEPARIAGSLTRYEQMVQAGY